MTAETALLVAAATSSLSAALLTGSVAWLYRIDKKTTRNHRALFEQPGLVEEVQENTRTLYREGMRNGNTTHGDD